MTNLKWIPAQDDFETTLSATYNGGVWSMWVFHVPDSTLPMWEYTYAVIEPWTQNMQVVKISGWTNSPKELIVSDITVEKANWVNYTAKSHPANSIVRVSNNYQFWKDIQNAVNSKADPSIVWDYSFSWNEISVTWDIAQVNAEQITMNASGSNLTMTSGVDDMLLATDGTMKLKDKNVWPLTLNQMINPPISWSAIEVMSEADFQQITPVINTAYFRYYN